MPILPKGNSKRSLGPNFAIDSGKVESQTLGSLVDFRFVGRLTTGATLPNFGQFNPVFCWEVEGVHFTDIEPSTSTLLHPYMGGEA